jgi:urease accessory protein
MSTARLLQLASSTLPVGGYTYSEGLESAIELGWIDDAPSAQEWIADNLHNAIATLDLPALAVLHRLWQHGRIEDLLAFDAELRAFRETMELRLADRSMADALTRLLVSIDDALPMTRSELRGLSFAAVFALAANRWSLNTQEALHAYGWSWLENQVLVATKLIPLGQTDGQRMLLDLGAKLDELVQHTQALEVEALTNSFYPQAMASAYHETQFTRIFRS